MFLLKGFFKLWTFLFVLALLTLIAIFVLPILGFTLGVAAIAIILVLLAVLLSLPFLLLSFNPTLGWKCKRNRGDIVRGTQAFSLENGCCELKQGAGLVEISFTEEHSANEAKIEFDVDKNSKVVHPFKIGAGKIKLTLPKNTKSISIDLGAGKVLINSPFPEINDSISVALGTIDLETKSSALAPLAVVVKVGAGSVKVFKR